MINAFWLILLPLAGALLVAGSSPRLAKIIAMAVSTLVLAWSILLAVFFETWHSALMGLEWRWPFLDNFGISVSLGADSISMWLVLLTTLLTPLCVLGSFSAITDRVKEYYAWLLILEAAMVGVFLARDLILFYVCFEFTLVPMFFLIAIWGSSNRERAAVTFFLFTFTGSLIALAGLLYVAWQNALATGAWSFDIAELTDFAAAQLTLSQQSWVLLALLAGFAVKVPLFPVHTWLPLAHTEAPAAGSVILAGVLLKLGTYGLYRFVLPMVPDAVVAYAPTLAVISIIGILYAALICWVQSDVKKLVAYSSVSHLGFCVLGLVALNPLGLQGSVLYMINHGLSTGALFFLIGMVYERYHTRDMEQIGGLAKRMPIWATFMVFFALASVGLPGLNGFISEFLCLIAAFTASADNATHPGVLGPWYAAIAGIGMIFAAMYLLLMLGKVVFGPLKEPRGSHGDYHASDLNAREIAVLAPLAVLCVYLGVQPKPLTDTLAAPIDMVLLEYPAKVRNHQLAATSEPAGQLAVVEGADQGGRQ